MAGTQAARPGCFPFRKGSRESIADATPPDKVPAAAKLPKKKYPAPTAFDGENPVNNLRSLEEALLCISDEPPHVARSTPKGIFIDTRTSAAAAAAARSRQHCLYDSSVYDAMLADSLDTCSQLQHNLDDWIEQVRHTPATSQAPSPPPPPFHPQHPATQPLQQLCIPASDSGNGTVSSLSESLSPIPQPPSPPPHSSRASSPSKTVTFHEDLVPLAPADQEPSPTKAGKRRVLRMVKF